MGAKDQGDQQETAGRFALAATLLAVAGFVDAVGFLKLGNLFVSFMSGNSTQAVVASIGQNWARAAPAAGIVVLFIAASFSGRVMQHVCGPWHRSVLLLLEAALLAAAGFAGQKPAIVAMVVAMGLQNAVLHRAGQTKTHLTFVTGTLVDFAERAADTLCLGRRRQGLTWLIDIGLWACLLLGAGLGAWAYGHFTRFPPLLVASLACLGLAVLLVWHPVRDRST